MDDPAELNMEAWPTEVAFVPYVGRGYWKGVEGRRVLLLGESHYREAGWTDDPVITRPFTRETFGDMETCKRTGGGKFFDELDRLLTGQSSPNVVDAAHAWQHVAFCNLSQRFAGTRAGHRPSGTDFSQGGKLLVEVILPLLRPEVILVLGRTAWRMFDHGKRSDQPTYQARHANSEGRRRRYLEERHVWSLDYGNGGAWMTWVYHPSWNVDCWEDRAAALRHLLKYANEGQRI
ncbi:hypothetical protein [Stenotrophomonas maltophilia]|uniref:hypothetical protein n=1 Tax=Stenotrophomonas maltophilia TaxID=40324 RepID=UPI00066AB219|nr:hypothetical protein [Stenotrophomonas maltophilia]